MDAIESFRTEKISRILLRIAPPVMLAQLIQALYNIVDSLFIGKYAESGLTALSIIYPVQLLMIAFGVGIGVGLNTCMASRLGLGRVRASDEYAGVGTPMITAVWLVFALTGWFGMPLYAEMTSDTPAVIADVIDYGRIVCFFSLGLFLESVWSKVLQAEGDMKTPMYAQIFGALTNIVLDPILIFGMFGVPAMGISGAAIATVAGQIVAAIVVFRRGCRKTPALSSYLTRMRMIFHLGLPNILMQSAYTIYIFGLNLILAGFCDQAVTALGLYYKWQTFFNIPLNAMMTCIVPVISFNYAARNIERCRSTLKVSLIFGMSFMIIAITCFMFIPVTLLKVFTSDPLAWDIGKVAFRIIATSFIPIVTSLIFPVFFQAVGFTVKSSLLTVIRTIILFVPLGYLFSLFGLTWFWLTFPVTEIVTSLVGYFFYIRFVGNPYPKSV